MENEIFLRFPQGKEKALTFSYDDGVVADKKLLSILNSRKLFGTFNLNGDDFRENPHGRMSEEEARETFLGEPHEIAGHGAKHLFLSKVSKLCAIDDVLSNKKRLEQLYNTIVCGFAYAYGDFNAEIEDWLAQLGIKYARTTVSTHTFAMPQKPLELNPTCHHTDDDLFDLADKFLKTAPHDFVKAREPYLFYVWGHSYEFDDNCNWSLIENFAEKLCGRDDVWYATNAQIIRCKEAFDRLEFSVDGSRVCNPSAFDVWFERYGETFCVGSGEVLIFE